MVSNKKFHHLSFLGTGIIGIHCNPWPLCLPLRYHISNLLNTPTSITVDVTYIPELSNILYHLFWNKRSYREEYSCSILGVSRDGTINTQNCANVRAEKIFYKKYKLLKLFHKLIADSAVSLNPSVNHSYVMILL